MPVLSKRMFSSVVREYRAFCGLSVRLIDPSGSVMLPEGTASIERLMALNQNRAHALGECVRWGETQVFFIAPGIMSWMVPLMEREELRGGLYAGYVMPEDDPYNVIAATNYFAAEGIGRKVAEQFVRQVTVFPQEKMRGAAEELFTIAYRACGWQPLQLFRNRDQMQQQRQIAEEIHQRKVEQNRAYPYDDERILLSHIRVGDRAGARRIFNKMLAAMFLYSPKQVVVRARAIEMMGYLVRAAVEDSPLMEPLLERHMGWIERIVETKDFDDLCNVLREALDDFMNSIFRQGVRPASPTVGRALDYIAENFTESVTLEDVARTTGLSTFRIAHLVKETTGKTVLQNIHYLRIQEARRLLESSDLSCTDIAYETGFGDQSYFIKQFRKWMGITPAKYRKSFRSA
ncbi:MAG: helix-turn-helix domain-containing protein [Kiritimatiellales bacterium]|nr:helix-turn-helix domain-containing protein [Kiritimatiellales bacterium]